MSFLDTVVKSIPTVTPGPGDQEFSKKLQWTGIVVGLYFLLTITPIYGLQENVLLEFQEFAALLGASFGTLATLGIGPIVTASIVLQLLNGSGITNIDTQTQEGKQRFQGYKKLLTIFFIVLQSFLLVQLGGFVPEAGVDPLLLIVQLIIGGLFIIVMDEMVSKWGFGSGVSLFIAAGVSQQIFIGLFNVLTAAGELSGISGAPQGIIPELFYFIFTGSLGAGQDLLLLLLTLGFTAVVFLMAVYLQAMKVEIPLSFGRVRGHGMRWPLNFLYANVIPIIFIGAIVANLQLLQGVLNSPIMDEIIPYLTARTEAGATFVEAVVQQGGLDPVLLIQALTFLAFYAAGAAIFSIFWVETSGLNAKAQAEKLMRSGMQVPGFRRDKRVLERVLQRYIGPITILGGLTIGLLAGLADLTGAIGTGTGLLLAVMIVYRQYKQIAKENLKAIHPALGKFME